MLKRLWIYLFALLLPISCAINCSASAYDAHPKLVIILVIDQFREDYLERYRADFKDEGFNLFLDRGAYFPDCYFDYGNLVTAAGHATIGTGAYTDGHGIQGNQWWDLSRNNKRPVSSVEDPRYSIVGLSNGASEEGASPRNLLATTLGDEVRLATDGETKLFGVSLKDRSAILTSGHTANGAFWIDSQSGAFVTSTYYMPSLPEWATIFNQSGRAAQARTEAGVSGDAPFYTKVGPTDAAITYELDFVQALIQSENLGSGNVTDVLTVSISSTDILGHTVGPDSPEERQLVDQLDGNLDAFFSWLDHNVPGGLKNVWIALTADHGVAPIPRAAQQLGVPAATIDIKTLTAALNKSMNDRFSPGEHFPYLLTQQAIPYIALNIPTFEHAGVNELEAERAVQNSIPLAMASQVPAPSAAPDSAVKPSQTRVPPRPELFRTFTRLQMASLEPGLPPTDFGRLIAHSYSPNGGWYVMLIPDAYQMQSSGSGTTHFSPYSYDRHVPLGFYGSVFTPGIYRGRVQPVDLAATLAAMLNVNQPSASIGQVLTQAIHPEETKQARTTIHRRKHTLSTPSATDNLKKVPQTPVPSTTTAPSTPAAPSTSTAPSTLASPNTSTSPSTPKTSAPPESAPPSQPSIPPVNTPRVTSPQPSGNPHL